MDLGRPPEARFFRDEVVLSFKDVTEADLEYVTTHIGDFGDDNRAGIERTLHRISAFRNRKGHVIGLTCRVGRAVLGTVKLIEDLIQSGKSTLLLGRPGVGKTTMLREVARVLADDLKKRVIIVDTSNEIAGDGDIPHPAIGHARRMQVPTTAMQHAVMIEAVENHMPEAIIIDEIGTELEALASRTIAERGVQLVGTAHGNTLENLILNPTLSDLVGGIQTVTLGDEEARRRGTQKSILERKAPPTFNAVVELQDFERVAVHPDTAEAVDALLRGRPFTPEVRWLDERREMQHEAISPSVATDRVFRAESPQLKKAKPRVLYLFGINRAKFESIVQEMRLPVRITTTWEEADMVVTSNSYYRRQPQVLRDTEDRGLPIYVLKSSTAYHIRRFLNEVYGNNRGEKFDTVRIALEEAQEAINQVVANEEKFMELTPQNAYVRRLQHLLVERHHLSSRSHGTEPARRVEIFR